MDINRNCKSCASHQPHLRLFPQVALLTLLATVVSCGAESGDVWDIQVQVLDPRGNKANDIQAATMWSANGPTWYSGGILRKENGKVLRLESLSDMSRFWVDEGKHEPYPTSLGRNVGSGEFLVTVEGNSNRAVFVMNQAHTLGACAAVKKRTSVATVSLQLAPLVRVTGKIFCPQANRTPDWTIACVHLPGDHTNELAFLRCGSVKGELSLLLPPGDYDLQVYSQSPDANLKSPVDSPADLPKWLSAIRINVPAGMDRLDLGVLNVEFPEGRGDYSSYYGKSPPPLDMTDTRGVPRDFKLESLHGKWVLLEFWSASCAQCVSNSLPELRELYEEYASLRERFEVLSICSTGDEFKTFDDFDPQYQAFVKKAWDGVELPFPILLDGELTTKDAYGVTSFPTALLVDPEGKLVKWGDAAMLEEKLKDMSPE